MPFKISDKQLLKRYSEIWERVEKLLKIEFDSRPVYGDNDKYIKTKINISNDSLNSDFQGKKMTKRKAPCKSLSVIMLDSVVKSKKKYYPQTLLEERKYQPKKIKMENLFDDNLEKSSSDETDNEADNDSEDSEHDNDESNE